ncbi:terminase large subunit [Nitratireductor sp. ZSWI3]|uniref:terminase large subunit n=1 Tax=Nitratireductor sp. ZSWI3 TaxID=2966359 RepID=UPI00214FCD28|nr:terminase TerL endonuclease subunit [Nitratireductor sp. ZSWI3]MCR4267089.1 terminase large subunit [Nitratireductor sp. ZSWI3]
MGKRGPKGHTEIAASRATAEVKKPRRRPSWQRKGLSRAGRVIAFIESLKITAGVHAGKPFKLRQWQREIIEAIYATGEDGRRTIRQALITIPRKNGKTALAAALALAHLVGPEAEARGQVYSAASDRDQAAIIFREMVAMIMADQALADRIVIREHNKTLADNETGSVYQAMSSDARKAHGLSPSFVVCDELAQWHGRDLYDNLITGTGARAEPLVVIISTKSAASSHVMSELVLYGEKVRDGVVEDPAFLPVIYGAAEDADPWDEATWFACNPALGDFRSLEEMRAAAAQAQRLPAREPSFRLLYLNQPVDPASRFLNGPDWRACAGDVTPYMLAGHRCFLGLDLSSTTDLTALAAWFPETGDLLTWFWTPAETLEEAERRDHVPYQLWARQGLLETTPGRAIDKSFVVHRIAKLVADFKVEGCAYDRWGIHEVRRLIADAGIKIEMIEWGQGFKDAAPALSAIETAVLQKKLRHAGHPVMDMCVANAVAITDPAGNRKLVKDRANGRIDGLVAASMALGLASRTTPKKPSVYQTRGVFGLDLAQSA